MSTIAAISTAPGVGGIGIVRMSGEKAFDILDKITFLIFIFCQNFYSHSIL